MVVYSSHEFHFSYTLPYSMLKCTLTASIRHQLPPYTPRPFIGVLEYGFLPSS